MAALAIITAMESEYNAVNKMYDFDEDGDFPHIKVHGKEVWLVKSGIGKVNAAIAAQKSVITRAKKSIATYRLREGQPIGTKVTLRGKRMYDFLDKLITVALPRVKDFRGLSKSKFDGRGNYAFGIKEHLIFPEISVDKIDAIRGMDIVIATTAKTDDEARALLTKIGLPLVLK